jgi:bifunctional UDP-N-acetylglucosamine pyrophosphorylase/glucosamine-1-phosphate N-acetyltransferase
LAQHVIDTARCLDPEKLIVVYGHGGEMVRSTLDSADIFAWAEQAPQLGTGHAVAQAVCRNWAVPARPWCSTAMCR